MQNSKLPGIHLQQEYRRYYPGGEVTAHVLGFTGVDDHGQEGIELAYDSKLMGKPGSRRVIKDRRGHIIEDVESIRLPQEGGDVTLSIDSKIQYLAYGASRRGQEIQGQGGQCGGARCAYRRSARAGQQPGVQSQQPRGLTGAQLRNRALTDTYEAGSTMKPFTAALGLEKGRYRFDTVIDTSAGRMTIGNATISDSHKHGMLTVAEVIQKSSNIRGRQDRAVLPALSKCGPSSTSSALAHPSAWASPARRAGACVLPRRGGRSSRPPCRMVMAFRSP